MKKLLHFGIIFGGVSILVDADSYYVPYLFVAILSTISVFMSDMDESIQGESNRIIKLGAILFSLVMLMANYPIWLTRDLSWMSLGGVYKIITFILIGLSGYCMAFNILNFSASKLINFNLKKNLYDISPRVVAAISFLFISFLDNICLFACKYPGVFTADSMDQITQLMTGVYSNHHPFYHTMVMKVFITIGMGLFNDMNAAAALYCVFQILFIAACFSFVIYTLCQMRISLKVIIAIMLFYVLMPFHIMYSFTAWKDVGFGGFFTLFTVCLYRIIKNVGKCKTCNYVVLFFSGLGVCLFRSNGFLAFLMVAVVFVVLFGWKEKKICVTLFSTILLALFMKYMVLGALEVKQPDTIEALSVPAQQIARVAVEHNDFTDEQRALLSEVIDIDAIPKIYQWWISNPVKNLVRDKNNQQYIEDNKFAFAKLYIQVGLKHPVTYIKAWVDETKGFWNAGYDYWRWADGIYENSYGMQRVVHSERMNTYVNEYLWIFSNNRVLQLFLCIGFYVWIAFYLLFMSIIRKDRIGFLMVMPILAVTLTLCVSTPVYSEFRYAYGMLCSIPFVIVAVFDGSKLKNDYGIC